MKIYEYPDKESWPDLRGRKIELIGEENTSFLDLLRRVNEMGNKAFPMDMAATAVTKAEMQSATASVDNMLRQAVEMARRNLFHYFSTQLEDLKETQTSPDVLIRQRQVPIDTIGIFIPYAEKPLFSDLIMLAVPAHIAECREIVLCTPPAPDGQVPSSLLYVASVLGITKVFKLNAPEAIAAMTCGTENIPRVHKIFAPPTHELRALQVLVNPIVPFFMPWGLSDLFIIMDETASVAFVVEDILLQIQSAELATVTLLSVDKELLLNIDRNLKERKNTLPAHALRNLEHSKSLLMPTLESIVDYTNEAAPQYVEVMTRYYMGVAENITEAGVVLIGNYTTLSAAHYVAGINRYVPFTGQGHAANALTLADYMHNATYLHISNYGHDYISNAIQIMSDMEGKPYYQSASLVRMEEEVHDEGKGLPDWV